jgi:hypothetical protein
MIFLLQENPSNFDSNKLHSFCLQVQRITEIIRYAKSSGTQGSDIIKEIKIMAEESFNYQKENFSIVS